MRDPAGSEWWQQHQQALSYESRALSAVALVKKHFGDEALVDEALVLDVGCGAQFLRNLLPKSEYIGLDIAATTQDVVLVDLNSRNYPVLPRPANTAFMLGVSEYLLDPCHVYQWLRSQSKYLCTTYDVSPLVKLRVNEYSHLEVESMLIRAGWSVVKRHGFWFLCA